METKVCTKCKSDKPIDEFNLIKVNGKTIINPKCKICFKEYVRLRNLKQKEKQSEWYFKNKVRIKKQRTNNKVSIGKQRKEFYEQNKERLKQDRHKDYLKNKERYILRANDYYKQNKKHLDIKRNERYNKRRKIDPIFKLKVNIKTLVGNSIKRNGYDKNNHITEILDCTIEFFKSYIESQFKDWMNWDNYGLYNGEPNYGWDIDHIKPLCSDKSMEGVIRLNHYTNLQPLCSYINRNVKRDKF